MEFYHVYVLELQNDKYYVGISKDVKKRFNQHKDGEGADWTKRYKPVRIVHQENTQLVNKKEAEHIENITTIQWMLMKGKENVRGGDYCAVESSSLDWRLGELANVCTTSGSSMPAGMAKSRATKLYRGTAVEAEKDRIIKNLIEDRNHRKGGAWCDVSFCCYNHCKKCDFGLSPWDKNLCQQHFMVRQ